MYILSQVFILLAYSLYGSTYIIRNRKLILFCALMACFSFMFGYLILDAMEAVVVNGLSIVRQLMLLHSMKKNNVKYDNFVLVFNTSLLMIASIFTYDGYMSLLPCIATVFYNYSIWQKSPKRYCYLGVFIEFIWLAYGIYLVSVVSIVVESVLLIVALVNYIKEIKKDVVTNK